MFRRRFSAVLIASAIVLPTLFSVVTPATVAADSINNCPPGKAPQFLFGFADLSSRLSDWMGAPTTCEFPDPKGTGDVHQQTRKGLAFWRKSTNTPTFTNGSEHWALTSRGFIYWQGSSIDPPANALAASPNPSTTATTPPPSITVPPSPPQRPVGPGYLGQAPDACDWTDKWGATPAYLCVYASDAAAWFEGGGTTGWTLLASLPRSGARISYTDAGRRSLGIPVFPAGNSLPPVSAYTTDSQQRCFTANPSCGRDSWWVEWNELQDSSYVRYSSIGAGFVTEARFREAVNMLWQWPEGKELLRNADRARVGIVANSMATNAYATYRSAFGLITINKRFTEVSTWMLADVLAHELRHAADDAASLWKDRTAASCLGAEQSAYGTERRFLVWLSKTLHPEGLPYKYDLLSVVSAEDRALASNLYEIGTTGDLSGVVQRDYHDSCDR